MSVWQNTRNILIRNEMRNERISIVYFDACDKCAILDCSGKINGLPKTISNDEESVSNRFIFLYCSNSVEQSTLARH